MKSYPHMCRDGHTEVGFRGDDELCPVCQEMCKRIRLEMQRDDLAVLAMRGDRLNGRPACTRCGGRGVVMYATTATWRGGIGGNTMTQDVCTLCWGSGTDQPWRSWRAEE